MRSSVGGFGGRGVFKLLSCRNKVLGVVGFGRRFLNSTNDAWSWLLGAALGWGLFCSGVCRRPYFMVIWFVGSKECWRA